MPVQDETHKHTACVCKSQGPCKLTQVQAWVKGNDANSVVVQGQCQAAATSLPACDAQVPSELIAGKACLTLLQLKVVPLAAP